ncbi:MAG: hypothetical protein LUH05_04630 [Candidatus Gastranaerophilales bacterium]|nr:hypothetical protein [Candidatus Gastranaerophilales bacterium]
MKINSETNNNKSGIKNLSKNFNGGKMPPLSAALYTLGNNDMLNASAVDIFAMDTPRTIIEFNHRGKQAGIEMGFREYTGTFIAEFSAALFAFLTSKIMSKVYKPEIKVNDNSWVTNKALDTFNEIYINSDKTPKGFIGDILNSMTGIAGKKTKDLVSVDKEKTAPIVDSLSKLITDKNLSKKEVKKISNNVHSDIINLLGADKNITIKSKNNEVTSNLTHVIRDIADTGRNVFFNENNINSGKIISKLKTINKSRIMLAIPAAMALAISNQYINRKMTKKRTGIDNFVGENGYDKNVRDKKQEGKEKGLLAKKLLSAGVFVLMLSKVMGIKKPADIIKKLEFDGPATGGNTIKTVYGTLILGRIFAAKDSTELRETDTRDYLGFLNWLVLGGFVAKGAAQLMDPKKEALFNITKEGSGIKHWLNDVSLKSQKEILAQGGKNAAKNLKKLNIAQMSGIAYSAIMLGVLLPKLNIFITKHLGKNKETNAKYQFLKTCSMEDFEKQLTH